MRTGLVAGILGAAAMAVAAAAQEPAAAPPEPQIEITETIDLTIDRTERMTVPVSISGRGPYGFVVDTGAERTVISRELAERLGLDAGRTATLYSMTEASRIETVVIPALEVGQRTIEDIHAPALARRDLGAEGMLGVDTLRSQRVEFDFVRQEMSVTPSRRPPERAWPSDTILITARSRYGHLMITDAMFEGQPIVVIVDTGSQVTVANSALRRRLERSGRLRELRPIELISVTGGRLDAEYGFARRIQLGGAEIRNLPVAFADVHPFRQLGLADRPAMLLGMDALQLFDRVSFDFANRRVRLLVRGSSSIYREIQVAASDRPLPSFAPEAELRTRPAAP
jgi:predicted aspartyl protease